MAEILAKNPENREKWVSGQPLPPRERGNILAELPGSSGVAKLPFNSYDMTN
jgi:hypothetical protein